MDALLSPSMSSSAQGDACEDVSDNRMRANFPIASLSDMVHRGYVNSALSYADFYGNEISFSFSVNVIAPFTPSHALRILSSFLSIFYSCAKISIRRDAPPEIRHYFRTLLRNCTETEEGCWGARADDDTANWFSYQISSDMPCPLLDDGLRMLEGAIAAATAHSTARKNRAAQPVRARAMTLAGAGAEHPVLRFADEFAIYHYREGDTLIEGEPYVPFALENQFYVCFAEEGIVDIDEETYLKYIGKICNYCIQQVVTLHIEDGVVLPKLAICLMLETWINASIGIYSVTTGLPYSANVYDRINEWPNRTNVDEWMMEHLNGVLMDIAASMFAVPFLQRFPSGAACLSDQSSLDMFAFPICSRLCHIRPFISKQYAVDAATHYYLCYHVFVFFGSTYQTKLDEGQRHDGILRVFETLSDYNIFSHIIPPSIYDAVRPHIERMIDSVPGVAQRETDDIGATPRVCELAISPLAAVSYAKRILRQTVEYNPCTLAGAEHVFDLPHNVQGESFVHPMPSAFHSPMSRCLRLDAYTQLVAAAHPVPGKHTVVQLPSQLCIFNRQGQGQGQGQGQVQHDYLYLQPRWADSIPDVYTAIINLSTADMTFRYMAAGRSTAGGTRARRTAPPPRDPVVVPPGHMLIYKRVAHDPKQPFFSWQCRLSECRSGANTGIPYMHASIAVYETAKIALADLSQIRETASVVAVGGVTMNRIYTGAQKFEKPGARRLSYPMLYCQLTNAYKDTTRAGFIENLMCMQRSEITSRFFQTVVLSKDAVSGEERLTIPARGGTAYNEQVGYMHMHQRMAYEEIMDNDIAIFKQVSNASVGKTRQYIESIEKDDGDDDGDDGDDDDDDDDDHADASPSRPTKKRRIDPEECISRIYPSHPPPMRSLQGLFDSRHVEFQLSNQSPRWELSLFGLYTQ